MRITASTDTRSFQSAMRVMATRAAPASLGDALMAMGEVFITKIELSAPRDTNRFVRAYLVAWNGLPGARPKVVPPLQSSGFVQAIEWALFRDLRYARFVRSSAQRRLAALRANSDRRGQTAYEKRVRRAERELDKAGDLEDIAIENMEAYERAEANNEPGFAMIFARSRGKKGNPLARSRISRVYTGDRVFGGEAVLVRVGEDKALLRFANREAHAFLVERRSRVLRRALADASSTGMRRASEAVVRRLLEASAGVSDGEAAA